jgi:PAS domain S-box-containing protein
MDRMPLDRQDGKDRTVAFEQRLQKARLETDYYRNIANETGKNHLRNIYQLSKLVSELKTAEQCLQDSQERYRSVVENLNVGMMVTVDQKIAFANSAVANFLGQRLDEILSHPDPFDFIHPEDRAIVLERHQKRVRGERVPENYSFRVVTKQGQSKWVEVTGTRIDWKGRPGTLNFFMDVTERIQAQQNQKKLEQKLNRAQKMEALGTLAGGIAHDFNNLMATALAYVSLMLCEIDPLHPHCEYLSNIEKQIRQASRLTSQLLGYARQGQYQVKPICLNQMVREVSETFGRTRKNICLHFQLQADLQSVACDQDQLEQVLLNLFVNASDAMPDGGHLRLKTRNISHTEIAGGKFEPRPGNYVELQVADTGIGISADIQDRIFDPFFTTKEKGRGTGLGLASVFGIVKAHGGYIDVSSQPGQGASFTLYFPASQKTAAEITTGKKPIAQGKGTILLVDDENMVLEAASRMLRKLGFMVHCAGSGREAIDLFERKAGELDMVILDMVMPEIGGEEVYQEIKRIKPKIKVLISSGYDCSGRIKEILDRECDSFIHKPFSLGELSESLQKLLSV